MMACRISVCCCSCIWDLGKKAYESSTPPKKGMLFIPPIVFISLPSAFGVLLPLKPESWVKAMSGPRIARCLSHFLRKWLRINGRWTRTIASS